MTCGTEFHTYAPEYLIEYLKSGIDISTVEGKTSLALEAEFLIVPDIMYTEILREKIQNMTGNVIPEKYTVNEKYYLFKRKSKFDIKNLHF